MGAQAERDLGTRPGLTSDERTRLEALERETHDLRQANEILRKASAFFAVSCCPSPIAVEIDYSAKVQGMRSSISRVMCWSRILRSVAAM